MVNSTLWTFIGGQEAPGFRIHDMTSYLKNNCHPYYFCAVGVFYQGKDIYIGVTKHNWNFVFFFFFCLIRKYSEYLKEMKGIEKAIYLAGNIITE